MVRESSPSQAVVGTASLHVRRLVLLVVLAGVAVLCRRAAIQGKGGLEHDEGISYLAATGHQREYTRIVRGGWTPCGTWVDAAEWKRLIRPEQSFCFERIAHELSREDIHPPMYFWLLHVWLLATGTHIWAGPALNAAVAVVAALVLFGFARYVLGRDREAFLVAWVYAVSPATVEMSLQARQYDLLALWAVLFAWQVLRCSDSQTPPIWANYVALGLITMAGLLTHYHFPLVLAAGAMIVLVRIRWRDRRRLVLIGAAVVSGFLFFAIKHPGFADSVARARQQSERYNRGDFDGRLQRTIEHYGTFLIPCESNRGVSASSCEKLAAGVEFLLLAAVVAGQILAWRRSRRTGATGDRMPLAILFLCLWMAGTNLALYLGFVSPRHAMTARHLALVWPFMAFLPALAIRLIPRGQWLATLVLGGLLFAGGVAGALRAGERDSGHSAFLPSAAEADAIVVDNIARGEFPRWIIHFPDAVRVFAAKQEDLLAGPGMWLDALGDRGLYVGSTGYGNSPTRARQALQLIASRGYTLRQVPGGVGGHGYAFEYARRRP